MTAHLEQMLREANAETVKVQDELGTLLHATEVHRDKLLTALRRILSLELKNVTKYAQQIARDALKE